jgi:DNA (cytosine-5)-methyltransferase 1
MKLLDLFCGAGGASKGYAMAGFEVTGVDLKHGKRYPYTYIKADAMEILQDKKFIKKFDVIHASPPCQTFSRTQHLRVAQGTTTSKVDLLGPTRDLLIESSKPYVIENVGGSPLIRPVQLCGSSFNLKVRRHRLFESNMALIGARCYHQQQGRPIGVYGALRDNIPGGGKTAESIEEARESMGINWMIWRELVEAIPPVYTKYIGEQVMEKVSK